MSVNYVNIGPANGLSPVRCQTINWTNADLLLIGTLRTNLNEILKENMKIFMKEKSIWKYPQQNVCYFFSASVCYRASDSYELKLTKNKTP